MREMVKRYVGGDLLVVDPAVNAGMRILYERPAEVGAEAEPRVVETRRPDRPAPVRTPQTAERPRWYRRRWVVALIATD